VDTAGILLSSVRAAGKSPVPSPILHLPLAADEIYLPRSRVTTHAYQVADGVDRQREQSFEDSEKKELNSTCNQGRLHFRDSGQQMAEGTTAQEYPTPLI